MAEDSNPLFDIKQLAKELSKIEKNDPEFAYLIGEMKQNDAECQDLSEDQIMEIIKNTDIRDQYSLIEQLSKFFPDIEINKPIELKDLAHIYYSFYIKGQKTQIYEINDLEKAKEIIKAFNQEQYIYDINQNYYIDLDEKIMCNNDSFYIRLDKNENTNDITVEDINEDLFLYYFNILQATPASLYCNYDEIICTEEYGEYDENDKTVNAFKFIKNALNDKKSEEYIKEYLVKSYNNPKIDYYVTKTGNIIISFGIEE